MVGAVNECCAFATYRVARAEASRSGGPQLAMLVLGPAGFDPFG